MSKKKRTKIQPKPVQHKQVKSKPAKARQTQQPKSLSRFILPVAGLVLILAFAAAAFALSRAPAVSAGHPLEISVAETRERQLSGAFLLDVREPHEWDEYHIPGATLIPLAQLASRVNELPQDQEIVVVCRSGNRSITGRNILLQAGFSQVSSMAGGMLDWRSAGYPVLTGP
jgi:rhodanese-related sulfurtransferase